MPLKYPCHGGGSRKSIINRGWVEFTGIYLFGVVTGIFLFGFVCVFYCIDKITIKGERDENKNNKYTWEAVRGSP